LRRATRPAQEFVALVEDVKGHALTLTLLGGFLKRAFHSDIRQRDRVKFEKAHEKVDGGQEPPNACSRCGTSLGGGQRHRCLKPGAFSTHVDDPVREPGTHRQKPPRTSEVFLLEGATEAEFQDHPAMAGAKFGLKRDGKLFRVNMGYNGSDASCPRAMSAPVLAEHTAAE
jgi:hypothetical protein